MKKLYLFAITIAALLLAGCTTRPPVKSPLSYGWGAQDCMPQAMVMAETLRNVGIKADVLAIKAPGYGHALCRYVYPIGSDHVWVYDSKWGAIRFKDTKWDDAQLIARSWIGYIGTGEDVNGQWMAASK